MPTQLTAMLRRTTRTVSGFTVGQKVVSVLVVLGLLLGGLAFTRWASAPSYTPLFTNLAGQRRLGHRRQAQHRRREVPAHRRRPDHHGAAEGRVRRADQAARATACPRPRTPATRCSTSRASPPRSSSSRSPTSGRWRVSSTTPSRRSAASRPRSCTWPSRSRTSSSTTRRSRAPRCWSTPTQGAQLTQQQVQSIVHLVSSSIEGMDSSEVTVVDGQGHLLSAAGDGTDSAVLGRPGQQRAHQRDRPVRQPGRDLAAVGARPDRRPGPRGRQGDRSARPRRHQHDDRDDGRAERHRATVVLQQDQRDARQRVVVQRHRRPRTGQHRRTERHGDRGHGTRNNGYVKTSETADSPYGKITEQRKSTPGAVHQAVGRGRRRLGRQGRQPRPPCSRR